MLKLMECVQEIFLCCFLIIIYRCKTGLLRVFEAFEASPLHETSHLRNRTVNSQKLKTESFFHRPFRQALSRKKTLKPVLPQVKNEIPQIC
jgi:hypothetical protein